jgi:SAM-dependent methyltransferase
MEHIQSCPVCGKERFMEFLKGKDFFLSGEEFTIVECAGCGFRFTNPRPYGKEISRYYDSPEYISHDAKKSSLFQSIYKTLRKFSVRNKFSIIKKNSYGKSILDIGCGTGEFLNFCQKNNYTTTGIEPNEKARKYAAANFGLSVYDENSLDSFQTDSFDVITMWHVLEHVHNINERLQLIARLLKSGGILVVAVPECNSWDAINYKEFWAAYDLPRHLYHFTQVTLKRLVSKHGLEVVKILPLKLDAFYISLLSEKYLSGKQNYPKAFFNGIRSNIYAGKNENSYSSLIYICKMAQEAK